LVLVTGWFAFLGLFARYRPHVGGLRAIMGAARATRSGLIIQTAAFAVAFWIQRPNRGMVLGSPSMLDAALVVLVVALMCLSIALAVGAVRVLGHQWALAARIVEAHRLITTGPFALVRHPIYAGLGGMLIASGLVVSPWWGLAAAVGVYAVGTAVRMRAEERLLLETFGEEYASYRARVPAVVPWRGVA